MIANDVLHYVAQPKKLLLLLLMHLVGIRMNLPAVIIPVLAHAVNHWYL